MVQKDTGGAVAPTLLAFVDPSMRGLLSPNERLAPHASLDLHQPQAARWGCRVTRLVDSKAESIKLSRRLDAPPAKRFPAGSTDDAIRSPAAPAVGRLSIPARALSHRTEHRRRAVE